MSVLRPYDAAIVKTYSDARNQLTGVIDSPQVLKTIEVEFLKTLVWVAVGQVSYNLYSAMIQTKRQDSDGLHLIEAVRQIRDDKC